MKMYTEFKRIFGVLLLFTLCGLSLYAQKPDSLNIVYTDSTFKSYIPKEDREIKPGEKVKPAVMDPMVEAEEEILADDIISEVEIQADSLIEVVEELEEGHSPRKAMIYSIVLPGLGQVYNKKYYKLPFVYAALGGAGFMIYYNTLKYREANDTYLLDQSDINLRYLLAYRRYMEMSYIGLVLVDALIVLDAYVDAHLFYWDVDPDLSIRMEPSIRPMLNSSGTLVNNYGFRCRLTF